MHSRSIAYTSLALLASSSLLACASAETELPLDEPVDETAAALLSDAAVLSQRADGTFDVTCKDGRNEIATLQQILSNEVCKPPPVTSGPLDGVASMTQRPDGQFDVLCKDGRKEIATLAQIQGGTVCQPLPQGFDPFDPASCAGPAITQAQALARFSPGASTAKLGDAKLYARKRTCQDQTGCGAWGPAASVPISQLSMVKYYTGTSNYYEKVTMMTGANATYELSTPDTGVAELSVSSNSIALNMKWSQPTPLVFKTVSKLSSAGNPALTLNPGETTNFSKGTNGSYTYYTAVGKDVASELPSSKSFKDNDPRFTSTVANTCLYASARGRTYTDKTAGIYTDYQVVFTSSYAPL